MALALFLVVCIVLMAGYPVALSLAGASLLFAGIGMLAGNFDPAFLSAAPNRIYGIITNTTLIAVPTFIFMGTMLERSQLASAMLNAAGAALGRWPGGLAMAVVLVGAMMAASTGIIGATVVTMGLLAVPTMLRHGYSPQLTAGTVCATGTLGQIIPPSIALVLLGDVMSGAYQQAQLASGVSNLQTVSVGKLFMGSLFPGLVMVGLYLAYIVIVTRRPGVAPRAVGAVRPPARELFSALAPTVSLIVVVLGSIIAGVATPTEAASIGAAGATALAWRHGQLSWAVLRRVTQDTMRTTSMVFFILIGAAIFSLVFRGFDGDQWAHQLLADLPGGAFTAMLAVMALMFVLGFLLDFIEITYVVVPIVAPTLLALGLDPVWLGVMIAVNLQTSFLTPPFGFALFYLRGAVGDAIPTSALYRGVVPFIALQALMLALLSAFPKLATWLPAALS